MQTYSTLLSLCHTHTLSQALTHIQSLPLAPSNTLNIQLISGFDSSILLSLQPHEWRKQGQGNPTSLIMKLMHTLHHEQSSSTSLLQMSPNSEEMRWCWAHESTKKKVVLFYLAVSP